MADLPDQDQLDFDLFQTLQPGRVTQRVIDAVFRMLGKAKDEIESLRARNAEQADLINRDTDRLNGIAARLAQAEADRDRLGNHWRYNRGELSGYTVGEVEYVESKLRAAEVALARVRETVESTYPNGNPWPYGYGRIAEQADSIGEPWKEHYEVQQANFDAAGRAWERERRDREATVKRWRDRAKKAEAQLAEIAERFGCVGAGDQDFEAFYNDAERIFAVGVADTPEQPEQR